MVIAARNEFPDRPCQVAGVEATSPAWLRVMPWAASPAWFQASDALKMPCQSPANGWKTQRSRIEKPMNFSATQSMLPSRAPALHRRSETGLSGACGETRNDEASTSSVTFCVPPH